MSDKNELLRQLAAVRRDLENLKKEASTAEGAMPKTQNPADEGSQNFRVVLQRLESVEELAGQAADKLRSVLKELDQ